MNTRRATHAGSWYQSDGKALGKELEEWLKSASAKVDITKTGSIIGRRLVWAG